MDQLTFFLLDYRVNLLIALKLNFLKIITSKIMLIMQLFHVKIYVKLSKKNMFEMDRTYVLLGQDYTIAFYILSYCNK